MDFNIPGDDNELRAALNDVNLPTLLVVMAQFSDDGRWLSDRFRPEPIQVPDGSIFPDDTGNYSSEIATEIRAGAFELIRTLRDAGGTMPPTPDVKKMRQLMEFSTAEPLEDEFCAMLLEETNFVNRDNTWKPKLEKLTRGAAGENFSVIVVGAGMSGICTGIKLSEAGIDYTILEKNAAVGGTWYENSYPDCGVDTPNHFYSYSFERNANWSGYFSKRDELHGYFERCTDQFGIRDNIQLNSDVQKMQFDAGSQTWRVTVNRQDGSTDTLTANAVISAVGQLNRPVIPAFDGLEHSRARASTRLAGNMMYP